MESIPARVLLIAAAGGILFSQSALAADEYKVEVRPVSLVIVSANSLTNRPTPFAYSNRLAITLLVESETAPLARVSAESSVMENLTDDKGADLLRKDPPSHFEWFPFISTNGHAAAISFATTVPPSRGSKQIRGNGKISLTFGTKKETFELKDISLAPQPLDVPGEKFEILSTTERNGILDSNAPRLMQVNAVRFRAKGNNAEWLESITFFDQHGSIIKSQRDSTSSNISLKAGSPQTQVYEWEYLLPRETTNATIKISIWTERESRQMPFSFSTGIGL